MQRAQTGMTKETDYQRLREQGAKKAPVVTNDVLAQLQGKGAEVAPAPAPRAKESSNLMCYAALGIMLVLGAGLLYLRSVSNV